VWRLGRREPGSGDRGWSGGDGCLLGELGDGCLVGAVCLAQPGAGGRAGVGELGETGDEDPAGQAGEEQGEGQAVVGDLVGAAVRDAVDDLVGAEPAQA